MRAARLELYEDGKLAVITLTRLDCMNALNAQMFSDLSEALDTVEATSSLRCLVITGEGKSFCAGQDLREDYPLKDGEPALGRVLEDHYNPLILRLNSLKMPTVAAVNGAAVGAGASLALACDIMVVSHSSYLQFSFCHIGLMPDAGATWFLPRIVGMKRSLSLMVTGEKIQSFQLLEWGIATRSFPDETFEKDWKTLALQLVSGATMAFYHTRQSLLQSHSNTLEQQLKRETEAQESLGRSLDFQEGIKAFKGRMFPDFHGK
jgi:2-(1,2-epoxy-1,2-dihydrophenyl)acetyl-CoA isomerase